MKKKSCLLVLGIALLTSCSFSIVKSSSSNSENVSSSFASSETISSYISTGIEDIDYDIMVKNDDIVVNNIDASVEKTGSTTFVDDGLQVGSRVFKGTINISFNSPIVINKLTFAMKAMWNDVEQEFTYNTNKTFKVMISKQDEVTYEFEEPTLLNSLSFTCLNQQALIFKGIKFNKCDPIEIESIQKKSDLEVELDCFVDITPYYEILPSNATFKDVIITSNDEFVVIKDNKVKATTLGNHVINVKTVRGNLSVDINLNCIARTIPTGARVINEARFTYDDIYMNNKYDGVTPSKGKVKMIVVPVNFSDLTSVYDFNNATSMSRLKAAFEGNKEDYSNDYYESLKSFYYKSSYGQLDFDMVFTDVYTPSFTSSYFIQNSDDYGSEAKLLINDFYNKATINKTKINFKDPSYDLNNDGYVDGIWFIYNDNRSSTTDNYWPYTYWYTNGDTSVNQDGINVSVFANCSVYFTYEGNRLGQDGHTLFHETGHMLGLDDYYVTSNTATMSALGGLDMMDYNIGDHNAFSKFSLGWVKPYVVEDEVTINLKPFESSGECVIIPTSSFNDSAFSEYIMLEYYTPTGINEFDAKNQYVNRSKYFTIDGIRMFHIDARLANCVYSSSGSISSVNYLDAGTKVLPSPTNYSQVDVASSNTPTYSISGNHLIEAITKNNVSTYKKNETSNNSLFVEGDIMDPNKYTAFFTNSKMHDNSTFNYVIEISHLDGDMATIKITKK